MSQQPQSGVITQNYYQAQTHKHQISQPLVQQPQTIKHHQTQSSSQSVIQKVNFTPFLPSNKLPGHFVPIVQTPYNSVSGGNNHHHHQHQHGENNNNNFVYQNNGASGSGGGVVIENSLVLSNNQNYNNDKKLSTGKPSSSIFVTSTPRYDYFFKFLTIYLQE